MNNTSTNSAEINKKRGELQKLLSKERTELLRKYFEAISNFYLLIPLKKALEIINGQNEEKYSEEAFFLFSEIVRLEGKYRYDILSRTDFDEKLPEEPISERSLAHEVIFEFDEDEYNTLLKLKAGKDYYIPPRDELLKYSDDRYEPVTAQVDAMKDFIDKYTGIAPNESLEYVFDILLTIKSDGSSPLTAIEEMMNIKRIQPYVEHYDEFEKLYVDLHNHTRNPYINGYTPEEYLEKTGNREESYYIEGFKGTKEELDKELARSRTRAEDMMKSWDKLTKAFDRMNVIQPTVKKQKIGRNDPCPCGSGKKYKKCCGA